MERIYLFGRNERTLLRDGWYDPERFEGGPLFRATAARARLCLPKEPITEIALLCMAPIRLLDRPLGAALIDPWKRTVPVGFSSDAWHVRRYRPPSPGSIVDFLDIVVENPWSPSRLFGSYDRRIVGVWVSAVKLSIGNGLGRS